MNIFEAGVIAGIGVGVAGGIAVAAEHQGMAAIGIVLGGLVGGAVGGWLLALFMVVMLAVIGVWRTAARRPARDRSDTPDDSTPSEAEIEAMTPIAIRGVFAAAFSSVGCGLTVGWGFALGAAVVVAGIAAVVAVFFQGRAEG